MRRTLLLIALVALLATSPAIALPVVGGPSAPQVVGEVLGVCEPLDPAHCLLPFPSDHFTVADDSTATGRRVNLSSTALPTNAAGAPWDPTEWNRNDGFSPGTPMLTFVPGLDLRRTWGIDADQLTDLSLSLAAGAPIALLDARTGKRHSFWSELDTHPDTTDAERLLIVRPARNLLEGRRYIVALRDLRDASGAVIEAPERVADDRVLDDLDRLGIEQDGLYRAWDFTVASRRSLSERVLAMRDDAFARLGDANLADGIIQGDAPRITIDQVIDRTPEESRGTARTITGTITVPNYLSHQAETDGTDAGEEEVPPIAVVGSRLHEGDDGLPVVNPLQPTADVSFECHLPHRSSVRRADGKADGVLYGHGLLGGHGEAAGSSTEDLRLRGFAPCAVDWLGMASADIANVVAMLADLSLFPSLPDRAQQGFVNFLYLGRALAHPDGFAALPAFQDAGGVPLIRTGALAYAGNSQGAIMGGALTALAPDFRHAVLGVPGMNYSTLLNRSVDWEGAFGELLYAAYPDKIDQQLAFGLIQMLWDRGEANGYAHHMTTRPLPNTPSHQVMLQVAYGDHQVANVTAEVEARTIGARLQVPSLGASSPHWSVDPLFGLQPARFGTGPGMGSQSSIVYWFSADRGNRVPPTGNVPPTSGEDPHGDPRKDNAASNQVAHFLRAGRLLDVCAGAPCVTTEATRSNG